MSVRNALLGLLAQRPRHGYDLRAAFEALVGGEDFWDVKPAQIYTTLSRLEEAGLIRQEQIEQDGGPEKHVYALTDAGQGELADWYANGVESEHHRDEFYVKLMLSIAAGIAAEDNTAPDSVAADSVAAHSVAENSDREAAVDPGRVIQAQRSQLYQELHDLTARRNKADPKSELAQIFLLDKTIMHLEADLRWLDMIESRLAEVKRQPMPEPEVRPRGRPKKIID
jgi:DNA-binding PadR family transcriptional regulator